MVLVYLDFISKLLCVSFRYFKTYIPIFIYELAFFNSSNYTNLISVFILNLNLFNSDDYTSFLNGVNCFIHS